MTSLYIQNDADFVVTKIGHVIERKPNPLWHIENMVNEQFYILAYALSGEAHYHFEDKKYPVKKGDILLFPKGFAHSGSSCPHNPWSFYSISFDIDFGNEISAEQFHSLQRHIRGTNLYQMPTLLSELNQCWTGKRKGYLIKCRSIMMDILYLVIKEIDSSSLNTIHYGAIERVLNMMNENYMHTYSIDELAALTGLSSSHFRLLFKRITGLTVVHYQNQMKICKAKDLLLSGDCNVTEAALSVGFNDIYYFSRLFKKITGVSPSAYIKI